MENGILEKIIILCSLGCPYAGVLQQKPDFNGRRCSNHGFTHFPRKLRAEETRSNRLCYVFVHLVILLEAVVGAPLLKPA